MTEDLEVMLDLRRGDRVSAKRVQDLTEREAKLELERIYNLCRGNANNVELLTLVVIAQTENDQLRADLKLAASLLNPDHDPDCSDQEESFNDNETCECGASQVQQLLAKLQNSGGGE